jgi:hypothetical protein
MFLIMLLNMKILKSNYRIQHNKKHHKDLLNEQNHMFKLMKIMDLVITHTLIQFNCKLHNNLLLSKPLVVLLEYRVVLHYHKWIFHILLQHKKILEERLVLNLDLIWNKLESIMYILDNRENNIKYFVMDKWFLYQLNICMDGILMF